ncbi:MAG: hypothetical protein JW832_12380 [Deltaproteobacteria bacterium]|nr:hypothetical protein [Deltaproteobacteria bacterium]
MKKIFSFVVLALALTCPARAAEFKASVYSESGYAPLSENSALNPDNRYGLERFRFYNRGSLTAKNSFNEYINGLITLEGLYIPDDYFPDRRSLTQLKVKELCVDVRMTGVTARIGKQYIKWGGGTFFNPSSDILNHRRDPLRPLVEAEGNRFAHILAPLNSAITAELVVLQSDEHGPRPKDVEDWAVVPKLSFSFESLSGFLLAEMQPDAGPLYGTSLEYVCASGEFSDLALFVESQLKTSTKRYEIEPGAYGPAAKKESGDSFFLLVAGARIQHSFAEAGWIDGISLLAEYYFDTENWEHEDYRKYIKSLRDSRGSVHTAVLSAGESFKNSRDYIYGAVLLNSVCMRDLSVLNGAVVNLQDSSFIWIPDVYYTFASQNATVGLRSYCFFGGGRSEFGSSPLQYQLMAYLELFF